MRSDGGDPAALFVSRRWAELHVDVGILFGKVAQKRGGVVTGPGGQRKLARPASRGPTWPRKPDFVCLVHYRAPQDHHTAMSVAATAQNLSSSSEVSPGRVSRLVWIPQLVAVGILGMTLPFKFSAAPESVQLFEALGAGAAGRIGTAVMESIAVLMLLIPALAGLGGLLTVGLMSGAIMGHVLVLGIVWDGDASLFASAVTAFVAGAVVVWMRRHELPVIGSRFQ
mgnify:CR=1 FL=1